VGDDPGLRAARSLALLSHVVSKEAVTMAFADVFWLIAMLFLAVLLFVPLLRLPQKPAAAIATEAH
jgi:DHA2 family multidrug resistance protein